MGGPYSCPSPVGAFALELANLAVHLFCKRCTQLWDVASGDCAWRKIAAGGDTLGIIDGMKPSG